MNLRRSEIWGWLKRMGAVGYARWVTPIVILIVIAIFGAEMAGLRWEVVKDITYIGHSDEAAYATMGKSLAAGKGLQVPYVTWFFIPYDQGVTRREDHWPPFLSFCMAPFYKVYGVSAAVAKLPGILIGAIGLPLATALLTWRLSKRGYIAIAAGLIVMGHHTMYNESLKTLSDVPAAMVMGFFCWALIAARQTPWMHVVAGIFAALCYYAKGSEILLVGLYPGLAVLMTGIHWPGKWAWIFCGAWIGVVLIALGFIGGWMLVVFLMLGPALLMVAGPSRKVSHWPWIGIGASLLLLAPFLYSNWKLYGDPLHTTQNYVAGYHNLDTWEANSYHVYWGQDLPKVSDRWERYGKETAIDRGTGLEVPVEKFSARRGSEATGPTDYWSTTAAQRAEMARMILLGVTEQRTDTREIHGVAFKENQWEGLGTVGREWEAYFRGESESEEMAKRRRGWDVGDPPNTADTPKWDSRGLIDYIGQWKQRSASWSDPWPRIVGLAAAGTVIVVLPSGLAWWVCVWIWRGTGRWRKKLPAHVKETYTARLMRWWNKNAPASDGRATPLLWGPVIALTILILVHAVLLVYFWRVTPRFAFVLVPLITAIGCTGIGRVLDTVVTFAAAIFSRVAKPMWAKGLITHWHVPATIIVAIIFLSRTETMKADFVDEHAPYEMNRYPYMDDLHYPRIGAALKARPELADAVIMCRNPWELLYHAADTQKGVATPYGSEEEIFAVARYYRVTHLLWDPTLAGASQERQQLERVVRNGRLRQVFTIDGATLFELDYSRLPNGKLPGMSELVKDP